MPPIIRPGRVALDLRKLYHRQQACLVSAGHLGATVAVLGRARDMNLNPRDEIDALREAVRKRQPLVVPKRKAQLYALALNVELDDLEHEPGGGPLADPFGRGARA